MVFFEAVSALASLDVQFFIDVTLANIVWVPLMYAIIVFLYDDKRTLYYFLILTAFLWIFLDFIALTGLGWALIGGAIWIVLRIIVFEWAETTPLLKKYLTQFWSVIGFGILLYVAFFG